MEHSLRRTEEELIQLYGDDLQKELKLEADMIALGQAQVRKQIAAARAAGNESSTSYGQSLLARSVDAVQEGLDRFLIKAAQGAGKRHVSLKFLKQVPSDVAAFIALKTVVDTLTGKKSSVQGIACRIGKRIEDEVRFAKFQDTDARAYARGLEKATKAAAYHRKQATMAGYERRNAEINGTGYSWASWTETERLQVGMALINIVEQVGLVQVETVVKGVRNITKVIAPSERIVEWVMREEKRSELLQPQQMPMLVPPLDWTTPYNGGYLTWDAIGARGMPALVKTRNNNYLTELADHSGEMPSVYEAVNALQRTQWRINKGVHEVASAVWERKLSVAGMPDRDDVEFVACPKCHQSIRLSAMNTRGSQPHACLEEDTEVLRKWKAAATAARDDNISSRSKRLSMAKALRVADTLAEHDGVYFPYQLDFRGRVYAIPTFNPQGNDLTKGLLHFAKGKPIDDGVAAGWLAVHGANTYGYDKASLEDRIAWVEEREDEIVACAADPMGRGDMWLRADKPWQFLAFCFEWSGFVAEGYGYVSRLPVALDGSCSGIQHFSAMLRDSVGGAAVNLLPSETPSDIYQRVCDVVVGKLESMAGGLGTTLDGVAKVNSPPSLPENEEAIALIFKLRAEAIAAYADDSEEGWSEQVTAAAWLAMGLNRKATKRQVMTLPYGSTRYSCTSYTQQWYKDRSEDLGHKMFPDEEASAAMWMLSGLIWDSISEVVIAARTAMDWLQGCARVVAHEELPVNWTTPIGFPVMQSYRNTKSTRVKTKLGESTIRLSLVEERKTINKRRMADAISPNFVHSMDATHLMLSVCYAADNGIDSFAMIHDSFGTHAADTNTLAACLREAFVDLYEGVDMLANFRDQIERQVSPDRRELIKPVPEKGGLDIQEVRSSDFFFC